MTWTDAFVCSVRVMSRPVIIFDWDDTLFASSAVTPSGLCLDDVFDLDVDTQSALIELETVVTALLADAMRLGTVIIITNSEHGWVELSAENFAPRLLRFIKRNKIPIISARGAYETHYPGSPSDWKTQAFLDNLSDIYPHHEEMNVLCLGDGQSERIAAHAFAKRRQTAKVKTVKFIDRPSTEELIKQISLVQNSLEFVWYHDGSFDIDLNFRSKTDED